MNTLSASSLLMCWENAQAASPVGRSLSLLAAAWPEVESRHWATLPIGVRDAWLLAAHDALFGTELDTLASCPQCAEVLESRFTSHDIAVDARSALEAPPRLSCDGVELGWRLPTSEDFLEVQASAATAEEAAWRLLERCVVDARQDGTALSARELPDRVIDRLQQEMARRDPGADMRVVLDCPACGHRFERRFDIGAYLWSALDDWAHRTLAEVHTLATAYGWTEPQVLALSAARRRHYIALVQS